LWKHISSEGHDLVKRMLDENPKTRISIKEALAHSWFTLEHTSGSILSIAQENMKKYCNENIFNLGKKKPEFSMVTCSPVLNPRYRPNESALLAKFSPTNRESAPVKSGLKLYTGFKPPYKREDTKVYFLI